MKDRSLLQPSSTEHAVPFTWLLMVLVLAIVVPLINLGHPKLGSPHEARVVVTGHNMAESGDYVAPRFNGDYRLQKPPLPYWTIAALVNLVGHPIDEGLFRLPSAIMGMACVLLTLLIARQLFDRKLALIAAMIQALSIKFIIEARLARVDIYLTFWVSIALLLLAIIFFGQKRRDWLWLLFGVAMGMGFLAKWVNILMFVLPPLIYGLVTFKDRRPKWYWHMVWVIVFFGLGGAWVGMLIQNLGWDTVKAAMDREVYDNITSPEHRANHGVFYYFPQLFLLTFPWSALTPAVFVVPFMKRFRDQRNRLWWVLLIIVVPFVILSFVSKKKADYLLPAMPALAILAARGWQIVTEEISPFSPEGIRNPRTPVAFIQPGLFLIGGLAAIGYCFFDREPIRMTALIVMGVSFTAGGLVALWYVIKGKGWPAFVAMGMGAAIFCHALFGFYTPRITRISSEDFADAVVDLIGDAPLVQFNWRDDTLVHYVKRPIPIVGTDTLQAYADEHPNVFVLATGKMVEEAQAIAPHVVLHHPRFRDVSAPLPGQKEKATDMYLLSHAPLTQSTVEFDETQLSPPDWINRKSLWLTFGLLAQSMFFGRFLLQWIVSEKKQESVIPLGFWWLSLAGGLMLFVYAAFYLRDPVIIIGQSTGVIIYLRNLYLIYFKKQTTEAESNEQ
ncbi:MAG: lipid-A-disaccharide synthase N-terminal domain-containing protein [Phycisphaeraceae bacterium]|nr:lipid-A-disaccharide synthase N-terminal domain-containing protein [Phycisphaeraceae bacterium]